MITSGPNIDETCDISKSAMNIDRLLEVTVVWQYEVILKIAIVCIGIFKILYLQFLGRKFNENREKLKIY